MVKDHLLYHDIKIYGKTVLHFLVKIQPLNLSSEVFQGHKTFIYVGYSDGSGSIFCGSVQVRSAIYGLGLENFPIKFFNFFPFG